MKKFFWETFIAFGLLSARSSELLLRLRSAEALMRKMITYSALLVLVACAGGGYIEVPTYQHYYFYEPHVAVVPASAINVKQDGATIDMAFDGSGNILSITTSPSRGAQGFIRGSSGEVTDYTGVLAFDAVSRNTNSIPMRLWVAASCRAEDWVILPSRVRLVEPTKNSSEIPLAVYLQPMPAVLHPDSEVFTGHWQYAQLDSNHEIRCQKGGMVAFTVGFEMTLTLTSLKIVFGDSLQSDGKVLHIPDVELSLTEGKTYKSTKRPSILQILLGILGSFGR